MPPILPAHAQKQGDTSNGALQAFEDDGRPRPPRRHMHY
jgi:hypothetical protein